MTPLVLAILLAAADPGPGAPGAPQPAAAPAKAVKSAPDPDKVVCRTEEQIGSRMLNRKCMTQRQWDALDEQTRQYFQDASDRGARNIPSGNPMSPH